MTEHALAQNPRVAFRRLDEAVVLVSPLDSSLYMLNPVASRVWELADGSRTIDVISQELVAEFEVSFETAHADVTDMVDRFRECGLLMAEGEESA